MVGTIDVITLNCQGLRSSASRETLFSWLNCSKIDFVCLQETHSVSDRELSRWLQQAKDDGLLSLDYQSISSPGSNRSCGVVILFQPRFTMVSSVTDPMGRFVSAQFVVDDHHFTICKMFMVPIPPRMGPLSLNPCMLLLIRWSPAFCVGISTPLLIPAGIDEVVMIFSRWAYNWSDTLMHLMDTYDLRDVWRLHHLDATAFTWHQPNSSQASRLDMFWLSAFFLPLIFVIDIFPFFRSDHLYVYLKFSLPDSIHRGPGVWKLNTAHLSDLSFIVLVTQFWETWQAEEGSFCALSSWWEASNSIFLADKSLGLSPASHFTRTHLVFSSTSSGCWGRC